MNYNNLPNFMKESGLFCLWKYEQRGDSKPSKVPYQVNGIKAQPNNIVGFFLSIFLFYKLDIIYHT